MSGSPFTPNAVAEAVLRSLNDTYIELSVMALAILEERLVLASDEADRARRMRPGLRKVLAVRRARRALRRAQVDYARVAVDRARTRDAGTDTVTIRKADR